MKAFLRLPIRLAMPRDPGAFRLFLALLVFVHHFSSFAVGGSAVYVFFMLSGFWIQRMWCARYAKARSPYLSYALSRLWRLAPVMIVVSALTIPLLWLLDVPMDTSVEGQWAHLAFSTFFFLGYAWLDYLPVAPALSLDVEMQFYLFAPLLALFVAKADFRIFLAL